MAEVPWAVIAACFLYIESQSTAVGINKSHAKAREKPFPSGKFAENLFAGDIVLDSPATPKAPISMLLLPVVRLAPAL